jgi:hypothetical protein
MSSRLAPFIGFIGISTSFLVVFGFPASSTVYEAGLPFYANLAGGFFAGLAG